MVQVADLEPSLDLEYVSEVTGETYVYNIGDMAWSESEFLISALPAPVCGTSSRHQTQNSAKLAQS